MDAGTWADWANALTGLGVGGAVLWLTNRTNKLAAAANRTSNALAAQEARRDAEAIELRAREQRLILVALAMPVGLARATFRTVTNALEVDAYRQRLAQERPIYDEFVGILKRGQLVVPSELRARLHFLDERIAAHILRLESVCTVVDAIVSAMPNCSAEQRSGATASLAETCTAALNESIAVQDACISACRAAGIGVSPQTFETAEETGV